MQILYTPEVIDGKQLQGDTLNKYGVEFEKGKYTEVENEVLAKKMLTCPYFSGRKKPGPKKKVTDGDQSADS